MAEALMIGVSKAVWACCQRCSSFTLMSHDARNRFTFYAIGDPGPFLNRRTPNAILVDFPGFWMAFGCPASKTPTHPMIHSIASPLTDWADPRPFTNFRTPNDRALCPIVSTKKVQIKRGNHTQRAHERELQAEIRAGSYITPHNPPADDLLSE